MFKSILENRINELEITIEHLFQTKQHLTRENKRLNERIDYLVKLNTKLQDYILNNDNIDTCKKCQYIVENEELKEEIRINKVIIKDLLKELNK